MAIRHHHPGTIAERELHRVEIGDRVLCVGRQDGHLFAVDDACPHGGGSLSEGWVDQGCVVCPLHGWAFDLTTGEAIGRPTEVAIYPIEDEGRGVTITLPDEG